VVVHLLLYIVTDRKEKRRPAQTAAAQAPLAGGSAFGLVFANPYLRTVALLMIVLNVVNTTGNFILDSAVERGATAAAGADQELRLSIIGSFYGSFAFWQNVVAVLMQAFLVSRIVKYVGLRGVLFLLPLVALGGYSLIAAGAGLTAIRWAKTAENATDYSAMNTGRQMLWLPTRREEKYKAKQAIDTFFVRAGDVVAAGLVFAGTHWLALQASRFALVNLALVALWLGLVAVIVRQHAALSAHAAAVPAPPGAAEAARA
jgi:AAA family ATP:ADP antiporter